MGIALGGGAFAVFGPYPPVARVAAETTPTSTTVAATTTTVVSPSTSAPSTADPGRGWLTIQGVGDTNFDPDYIPTFVAEGYGYAFGGLDGLFLDDDLTVVNLECAASDLGTPLDKTYAFGCDPAALPIARANGVDVANLANNHGQDRGSEALLDARANLLSVGIAPVGVGADLAEATTPALFDIGGWTVAVLGFGGVIPGASWLATDDHPGMASGDDIELMAQTVTAAAEVADIVVVTVHWGEELVTEPSDQDRERAAAMIAAGADVVFGHHSHRLGSLEYVDGRPVFWTLGNFVWPRLSDAGATTAVARVVVSPDGAIDACLIPAFIRTSGRPELVGPAPCAAGTG